MGWCNRQYHANLFVNPKHPKICNMKAFIPNLFHVAYLSKFNSWRFFQFVKMLYPPTFHFLNRQNCDISQIIDWASIDSFVPDMSLSCGLRITAEQIWLLNASQRIYNFQSTFLNVFQELDSRCLIRRKRQKVENQLPLENIWYKNMFFFKLLLYLHN